jgi:hypothetical protein
MAHAEHTSPDEQYEATPPGAGYEHTDANVWLIAKFVLWLAVIAVAIHVGLGLLFDVLVEQRVERALPTYPLASGQGQRVPPEPRLQQFPREDIMNLRVGEEELLQNYGWVDKNAGTVHIPITDAMKLTLQRGFPSRPQQEAEPGAAPGMTPSDSSAGRKLERTRQ